MKREILFRGKRINGGEWVYGMTISNGTIKRKAKDISFEVGVNKWVGMHPETLGQYTGLKDKNGKKIFEGDIVHIKGDVYDFSEVGVDFHRIVSFYDGAICLSAGDWLHIPIGNYVHGLEDWDVVGNITDTPELMK